MMTDSDQLRGCYEGIIKNNPSDADAVQYLAVWHLERHSFQQVGEMVVVFNVLLSFMSNVYAFGIYRPEIILVIYQH